MILPYENPTTPTSERSQTMLLKNPDSNPNIEIQGCDKICVWRIQQDK
jgi:hypothetical protein